MSPPSGKILKGKHKIPCSFPEGYQRRGGASRMLSPHTGKAMLVVEEEIGGGKDVEPPPRKEVNKI
jgi:hypothetical protein